MVWVAGFRRELGLFSLASFFAAAPGADGTDGFVDSGETNVPFCGLVLVTFSFLTGDGGGGGDSCAGDTTAAVTGGDVCVDGGNDICGCVDGSGVGDDGCVGSGSVDDCCGVVAVSGGDVGVTGAVVVVVSGSGNGCAAAAAAAVIVVVDDGCVIPGDDGCDEDVDSGGNGNDV